MFCHKNERGFTLVEVMIALLIMGFALIPFLSALSKSRQATAVAKNDILAVNLAQGRIEEIKDLPYSIVNNMTGKDLFAGVTGYTYQIGVVAESVYQKTVAVSVYYQGDCGERSVTLIAEKVKR